MTKLFSTLFGKLALALCALLLVSGTLYFAFMLSATKMFQDEVEQRLNIELAKNLVRSNIIMTEGKVNPEALKGIFDTLMVINPAIEVYLLDPEGKILSYSAPPGKVKLQQVDLGPIQTFLEGKAMTPLYGDDPRGEHRKIFSVWPVASEQKRGIEGYLYVILAGESRDSIVEGFQNSYFVRLGAWALLATLVIAFVIGLFIYYHLTKRLVMLADLIDTFKISGFQQRPGTEYPATGKDEIERLGIAYNEMSERILKQVDDIQRADTQRRELIANISHDIRTPLSTVQGYIETLLMKNDSLSEEKRKEYLTTAEKQCTRLARLVSELLELAKLDSPETKPKIEPFSLAELLFDIAGKFSVKAADKESELVLDVEKDLPPAQGDIALIERAVENLIENALKYSGKGARVLLSAKNSESGILLRVEDNGPGIPQEDLGRIFDRFYRVDKSRSGDERGSGLGLAITKRIVELHKSAITAESPSDTGAVFSFILPLQSSGS